MLRFNVLTGDTSMHEPLGEASSFTEKPRGFGRSGAADHTRTHERPCTNSAPNNPFDLANAAMLPPLLGCESDPAKAETPMIRTIPNKFPVLKLPLSRAAETVHGDSRFSNLRKRMPAAGRQEVIIQHWKYNHCQALSTREESALLWRVFQQRMATNADLAHVAYVQLLENHGVRSGASLPHPHAQLLALPFVPGDQLHRLELAHRHYVKSCKPENPFDMAIEEARDAGRILVENSGCAAFVPYGLDRSYEIWIVSKCKGADTMVKEPRIEKFAECVRLSLKMLYQERDDPPYNMIVRQSPTQAPGGGGGAKGEGPAASLWYRWHAVILPHNAQSSWAGVKGYGNFVPMTGTPEDHSEQLRRWRNRPFEHLAEPPPGTPARRRNRAVALTAGALFLSAGLLMSRWRR